MIRAIIAAQSPIIREGLRGVLAGTAVQVIGVATSPSEAADLAASQAPHLAFVGIRVADLSRLGTVKAIRRASPETAVVVVNLEDDEECLLEALRQGASCYLRRDISARSLLLAAEAAVQGFVLADPSAVRHSLAEHNGSAEGARTLCLTPREREVLQLLARGLSNREIANALTVSPATVRTHVSNILNRLGVADRVQAAVLATRYMPEG